MKTFEERLGFFKERVLADGIDCGAIPAPSAPTGESKFWIGTARGAEGKPRPKREPTLLEAVGADPMLGSVGAPGMS
ncbi:MAG: hypothetical protein ABL974_03140, partial [Prosthecobacter sp.]